MRFDNFAMDEGRVPLNAFSDASRYSRWVNLPIDDGIDPVKYLLKYGLNSREVSFVRTPISLGTVVPDVLKL